MDSKSNPALSDSLPSKQLPFALFTVYTILSSRFMLEYRVWHASCDTLEAGNVDQARRLLGSIFPFFIIHRVTMWYKGRPPYVDMQSDDR